MAFDPGGGSDGKPEAQDMRIRRAGILCVAALSAAPHLFSGCSTTLVVRKVSAQTKEVKGLRYYLGQPFLRISTFEVKDVYDDGSLGPPYTKVEHLTEILPDPSEMYEVNFVPGILTRNQFTWAYDDKFGSLLKALAVNGESQMPETLKSAAEIPKGVAEAVKELKGLALAATKKKVAESVTLKRVEYKRMVEGVIKPSS
jgi:ribosomal protein L19